MLRHLMLLRPHQLILSDLQCVVVETHAAEIVAVTRRHVRCRLAQTDRGGRGDRDREGERRRRERDGESVCWCVCVCEVNTKEGNSRSSAVYSYSPSPPNRHTHIHTHTYTHRQTAQVCCVGDRVLNFKCSGICSFGQNVRFEGITRRLGVGGSSGEQQAKLIRLSLNHENEIK